MEPGRPGGASAPDPWTRSCRRRPVPGTDPRPVAEYVIGATAGAARRRTLLGSLAHGRRLVARAVGLVVAAPSTGGSRARWSPPTDTSTTRTRRTHRLGTVLTAIPTTSCRSPIATRPRPPPPRLHRRARPRPLAPVRPGAGALARLLGLVVPGPAARADVGPDVGPAPLVAELRLPTVGRSVADRPSPGHLELAPTAAGPVPHGPSGVSGCWHPDRVEAGTTALRASVHRFGRGRAGTVDDRACGLSGRSGSAAVGVELSACDERRQRGSVTVTVAIPSRSPGHRSSIADGPSEPERGHEDRRSPRCGTWRSGGRPSHVATPGVRQGFDGRAGDGADGARDAGDAAPRGRRAAPGTSTSLAAVDPQPVQLGACTSARAQPRIAARLRAQPAGEGGVP